MSTSIPDTVYGRLYPLYDSGSVMNTWRILFSAPEGTTGQAINGWVFTVHHEEHDVRADGVSPDGTKTPVLRYSECTGHEDEEIDNGGLVVLTTGE